MHERGQQTELAQILGELARSLQDEADQASTLDAIVAAAVDLVPGTRCAGVSLVEGKQVQSRAASDHKVREIDQLQSELGEGPSLTAIREQHAVRIDDLAAPGQTWPRFAARAVQLGVLSMLSVRLFARERSWGALNLYGDVAGAFTADAEILADLVSEHAAVALAGAAREEHLSTALDNRDVIGQAKGILMHRDGITGHQAFALLVKSSQETNMKVADVARWLVDETEDAASAP